MFLQQQCEQIVSPQQREIGLAATSQQKQQISLFNTDEYTKLGCGSSLGSGDCDRDLMLFITAFGASPLGLPRPNTLHWVSHALPLL